MDEKNFLTPHPQRPHSLSKSYSVNHNLALLAEYCDVLQKKTVLKVEDRRRYESQLDGNKIGGYYRARL